MSEYVIGIDPGIAGALALVSRAGELIEVADMPILRDGSAGRASVNAPLLAELLARWHAREVICEFVAARPGEGPTGAFSFGRCRGVIEGACAALGLPIRFVTPPSWKRLIGIPPGKDGAKDRSRAEAIRRWPAQAGLFARVKDDARSDAALIGLAGILKNGGFK
jgi:crossover junction endodeoxyribonuclease RuvC